MVTNLLVVVWLTSIVAVLRAEPVLAAAVGSGHSICGPWGCGPPLSSLLVWHSFVTILLVPPAIIAAKKRPDFAVHWAGLLMIVVGLAAATFAVTNLAMWWNSANDVARGYIVHRALFSLVAFTDAPIVPATLTAAIYWWMGRRHPRTKDADVLSTNDDLRAGAKQVEDFSDVAIGKMDTAL